MSMVSDRVSKAGMRYRRRIEEATQVAKSTGTAHWLE